MIRKRHCRYCDKDVYDIIHEGQETICEVKTYHRYNKEKVKCRQFIPHTCEVENVIKGGKK